MVPDVVVDVGVIGPGGIAAVELVNGPDFVLTMWVRAASNVEGPWFNVSAAGGVLVAKDGVARVVPALLNRGYRYWGLILQPQSPNDILQDQTTAVRVRDVGVYVA